MAIIYYNMQGYVFFKPRSQQHAQKFSEEAFLNMERDLEFFSASAINKTVLSFGFEGESRADVADIERFEEFAEKHGGMYILYGHSEDFYSTGEQFFYGISSRPLKEDYMPSETYINKYEKKLIERYHYTKKRIRDLVDCLVDHWDELCDRKSIADEDVLSYVDKAKTYKAKRLIEKELLEILKDYFKEKPDAYFYDTGDIAYELFPFVVQKIEKKKKPS